jgi:hypothetical protein
VRNAQNTKVLHQLNCAQGTIKQQIRLTRPVCTCCLQVVSLKAEFQARIREAEALKLQLARAEGTVNAASGTACVCDCMERVALHASTVIGLRLAWCKNKCMACSMYCMNL